MLTLLKVNIHLGNKCNVTFVKHVKYSCYFVYEKSNCGLSLELTSNIPQVFVFSKVILINQQLSHKKSYAMPSCSRDVSTLSVSKTTIHTKSGERANDKTRHPATEETVHNKKQSLKQQFTFELIPRP